MKQIRRKIGVILLALVCVLSLGACGGKKAESTMNEDVKSQVEQNAEGLVQTILELSDSDIDNYANSGDEFTEGAMEAWSGAKDELGNSGEIGSPTTEYSERSKEYTVTVPVKFKNADSNFVFEFDKTGTPSTLSVEVQYPTSVNLERAALNTVMGLATVFIVLIFLTFVISLLKYIPGWIGSFGKKKQSTKDKIEEPVATEVAESVETVTEDVTDDTELVAVIAAAIAASEGTSTDGFQVRSIRRVKRRKW